MTDSGSRTSLKAQKKRERNQQGCAPAFSYSVKTDYASVSSLAPSSPKSSTFFLLATMRS